MKESEYFKSEEFKEDTNKIIEKGTWDKGLFKIYRDKQGNLVEHYKNGRIEIIKTKEELNRR